MTDITPSIAASLPAAVQEQLDDATLIRMLADENLPYNIENRLTAGRIAAIRARLPVTAAVRLATTTQDPAVLDLLSADRRVSVADAVAKNHHLGTASAERLLDEALQDHDGDRRERITRLLVRLIENEGVTALQSRLSQMALSTQVGWKIELRHAGDILACAAKVDPGRMGETALRPGFEDATGTAPLAALAAAAERTADLLDAGVYDIPALAAAATTGSDRVRRWAGLHSAAERRLLIRAAAAAVDGEMCGQARSLAEQSGRKFDLADVYGQVAAADQNAAADMIMGMAEEARASMLDGITVDLPVLTAMVRLCESRRDRLNITRELADSIIRAARVRTTHHDLTLLTTGPTVIRIDEKAAALIAGAEGDGAWLLATIAALSGQPHPALTGAFDDAAAEQHLDRLYNITMRSLRDIYPDIIISLAGGDGRRAAEQLVAAHGRGGGYRIETLVLETCGILIARGAVTLADLACGGDGGETVARLIERDMLPPRLPAPGMDGMSRAGRPVQRRILRAVLQSGNDSAAAVMRKWRPWDGDLPLLLAAAREERRIVPMMSGSSRLKLRAAELTAIAEMIVSSGDQDAVRELTVAAQRSMLSGRRPGWLGLLAEHVDFDMARRSQHPGAAPLTVALVRTVLKDDELEVWSNVLRLIGGWGGTAAELVETARGL